MKSTGGTGGFYKRGSESFEGGKIIFGVNFSLKR